MIEAVLLGSSGTMPLWNRPLTSLFVKRGPESILVDCGEGTQIAAKCLGVSLFGLNFICLTHLHADHVLGIPGLLLSLNNNGRKEPITIAGPRGTKKCLSGLLSSLQGLHFQVIIIELTNKFEKIELRDVTIEAFSVKHNCPCYGYSFLVSRPGAFSMEKALLSGVPQHAWGMLQSGLTLEMDGKLICREDLMGEDRKGLKITYVTDTLPTDSIVKYASNADLLFLEGMYLDKSSVGEDKSKAHLTAMDAVEIAKECCVGCLVLTHFSPAFVHPEKSLLELRSVFPRTICGYSGFKATMDFDGNFYQGSEGCHLLYASSSTFSLIACGKVASVLVKGCKKFSVGDPVVLYEKAKTIGFTGATIKCEVISYDVTDGYCIVNLVPRVFGGCREKER